MIEGTPAVDIADVLARHPLSEVLPVEVRQALARLADVQHLAAGETLVEQGGPGDAGFLVVSGRLRVTIDGVLVGTIGPGETVGEMALLTGEPRSATVLARRPSTVIRIGADEFLGVLADHPQTHRTLSRILVQRLDRTQTGRTVLPAFATIVAIAGADADLVADLTRRLGDVMTATGIRVAVSGHELSAVPELESANDVVLIATDLAGLVADHAWFDRSVAVIDGVAEAGAAVAEAPPGSIPTTATDVVLVHGDDVELPSGTRRILGARLDVDHHHLRRNAERDLARLARRLLGRERVLVLGGGGARGLAHLGTYRALHEAGIDIDAVVGVSAGAMFGAPVALGWNPDQATDLTLNGLTGGGRLIDYTIPLVALSSGRRITEGLQATFGAEVDLEDLWCPLTALSADLTTLSLAHLGTYRARHRRPWRWRRRLRVV
ncbi:MAG: cyclic nucleotide-binding and patatin-like phospholipase domain-containing protein, partial [Actinomycetota bacterium]